MISTSTGPTMARKKRDDDEDIEFEDAEPEEELAAEDDSEEIEEAVEEEPAELEAADEDAALADDEEPPGDDEPPVDQAEEEPEEEEDFERPPRPRTPVFTIVLLFLNLVAAPPFVILLVMNYSARQQWTYATFLNRVAAYGLPLAEEEAQPSAWYHARPRLRTDSDKIKASYQARRAPPVTDQFQPVDTTDEPLTLRIRPSQIDDEVKRELFGKIGGDPVSTIDEEVARLKRTVPQGIQDAAAKYGEGKNPDQKLDAIKRILLPLAWSTKQVEVLNKRIEEARGNDAALSALLAEAVERRILTDLLAPVNIYRPGDIAKFPVEKVADLDTYKIEELRDILLKRFDEAIGPQHIGAVYAGESFDGKPRDDIEKRHAVAFLMVAIAQLKAPDAKEALFPRSLERAQVVNGLFEFAMAAGNYPRTIRVLEQHVIDAIVADREGYVVQRGKDVQSTESGFRDQLGADIERLRKVKAEIDFTQNRIKDLMKQRDRYMVQYNDRVMLLTDVTKKLLEAKTETAKLRADLQEKNEGMRQDLQYLATAAAQNARLQMDIVAAERELMPKGGKR
jgi:hypothetical protein